jgi:hypothetical protein
MFFLLLKLIAALRVDKESLETSLYEAQQIIQQLESRKEQLESENQELLIRKESSQAEIARLHKELDLEIEKGARNRDALNQKIVLMEQESHNQLKQCKQSYEDEIERILADRERVRKELEQSREEAILMLNHERDELIQRFDREKGHLSNEVSAVSSDRDAVLINAENEKQQV